LGAILALVFGVLAVAAILTGCGDGEDANGQTAITKEEFVKQANAICSNTRRRIEAEFAAYGRSGEAKEAEEAQQANELTGDEAAARVGEKILIPAMRQQLEELRSLDVPSESEDRAEALLGAFGEGIKKAEARPERAARDGTEAFGKSGRLAGEYGIESC